MSNKSIVGPLLYEQLSYWHSYITVQYVKCKWTSHLATFENWNFGRTKGFRIDCWWFFRKMNKTRVSWKLNFKRNRHKSPSYKENWRFTGGCKIWPPPPESLAESKMRAKEGSGKKILTIKIINNFCLNEEKYRSDC